MSGGCHAMRRRREQGQQGVAGNQQKGTYISADYVHKMLL